MSINVVVSRDGQDKCYSIFNFEKKEEYMIKVKGSKWVGKLIEVPDEKFLELILKEICDLPQDTDLAEFIGSFLEKEGLVVNDETRI